MPYGRLRDSDLNNRPMADNYLEKKYDEVFAAGRKTVVKHVNPTLDTLLLKNRSHRGYSQGYVVERRQLETIIAVNTRTPSARNQQVLRFRPVTSEESEKVLPYIRLGGALPELHLPAKGEEPRAFIVACTSAPETKFVDIDLGISLQSMSLKAVEMGLNCITICAFDKAAIMESLGLQMEPLAILAVGKGTDSIQLLSINADADHAYYRKDGIHYVPKLSLGDLII